MTPPKKKLPSRLSACRMPAYLPTCSMSNQPNSGWCPWQVGASGQSRSSIGSLYSGGCFPVQSSGQLASPSTSLHQLLQPFAEAVKRGWSSMERDRHLHGGREWICVRRSANICTGSGPRVFAQDPARRSRTGPSKLTRRQAWCLWC